jgi:hypothetical protein
MVRIAERIYYFTDCCVLQLNTLLLYSLQRSLFSSSQVRKFWTEQYQYNAHTSTEFSWS